MADDQRSLPLAPPAFANPSARGNAAQTPLSNADFRKARPVCSFNSNAPDEPGLRPAAVHAAARPTSHAATGQPGASREKKQHFRPKPRPAVAADDDGGGDGSLAYRDRAAERRDDANPDYAGLAGSLGAASSRGFSLGAPVAAPLSVEETRYLGGDLEHTHLVKGLDFALLQKVRSEQQSHAGERPETTPAEDVAAAPPTVRTSLGRAVHALITGQRSIANAVAERLAQGRVAFVFNLDELDDAPGSDLPATLLRSRAADDTTEVVMCAPDAPLLLRAGEAIGRLRLADASSLGKKLRRKEKPLEQAASREPEVPAMACTVAVDEDIFGDAGRAYVCEPSKPRPAERGFAAPPLPYFSSKAPAAEVVATAFEAPMPAPAAAERLRKLQELDAGSAYGELFPGDGGYALDLAGSDDEGGDAAGAPKAAKQKVPPKKEDAAKARDAKLSSQLQDVRRALAEKHGEKFEGAFSKRDGDDGRLDDAAGEAKARAKRLRL